MKKHTYCIALSAGLLLGGCAALGALSRPTATMQDVDAAKAKDDKCFLEKVCHNEVVAHHPGNQDGHFLNPVRKDACRYADITTIGPRPEGVTGHCAAAAPATKRAP